MGQLKTPKKPVLLGSASSENDPIPHVCFLVNVQSSTGSSSSEIKMHLKQQLIRVLLLFHTQINPDFSWSFEFLVQSKKKRAEGRGEGPSSRSMWNLGLDEKSLAIFSRELDLMITESDDSDNNDNKSGYTIADLVESIKALSASHSRWSSSPATRNLSPFKIRDSIWAKWQGNVKLRNYLIFLSPLPSSEGKTSLQSLLGKHVIMDQETPELLETFRGEMMDQDLWVSLLKSRIALFWFDPFPPQLEDKESDSDCDHNSKESSLIDIWTMSIMRIYGGACLNYNTLNSADIVPLLARLFRLNSIDVASSKSLFIPPSSKSKREAFMDFMAEKSFLPPCHLPRLWNGVASFDEEEMDKFSPQESHYGITSIPSHISMLLTGANKNIQTVLDLKGAEIKVLKVMPDQLSPDTRTAYHCMCSGPSLTETEAIALFLHHLSLASCVLLLEISLPDGYQLEAILKPQFVTLTAIQVLPESISASVDWDRVKETQFEPIVALPPDKAVIHAWFSEWENYLVEFLRSGKILPTCSKKLEGLCMDIWSLEKAKLEPTPKKKGPLQVTSKIQGAKPDQALGSAFAFNPENFETFNEALEMFHYYYACVLYGKYSLAFLVDTVFPSFYGQLFILADKEGVVNASESLVSFFMNRIAISVEELEDRHTARPKSLAFLTSANHQNVSAFTSNAIYDGRTALLIDKWFREKKSQKSQGDEEDFLDLKSLLRASIKELRQTESQLQIIFWLECLRIGSTNGSAEPPALAIPSKTLFKEKKKKKKQTVVNMREHIVSAIHILADKLMIWTAGFGSDLESTLTDGIWHTFIKPVLVKHYRVHFCDLVDALVAKTGGDVVDDEDNGEDMQMKKKKELLGGSPFFKKGRTPKPVDVKPRVVKGGKVQKALSRKALLEKRLVAPEKSGAAAAKKRKKGDEGKLHGVKFAQDQGENVISVDDFFSNKNKTPVAKRLKGGHHDESVFVPETPGDNIIVVKRQDDHIATSTPSAKRVRKPEIFSPIWQ